MFCLHSGRNNNDVDGEHDNDEREQRTSSAVDLVMDPAIQDPLLMRFYHNLPTLTYEHYRSFH
jgi:hypothetical protein